MPPTRGTERIDASAQSRFDILEMDSFPPHDKLVVKLEGLTALRSEAVNTIPDDSPRLSEHSGSEILKTSHQIVGSLRKLSVPALLNSDS